MMTMITWTHFHVDTSTGVITLFSAGTCDHCGSRVIEANAVTGGDSPEHYLALGITEHFGTLPGEILITETDELRCERC